VRTRKVLVLGDDTRSFLAVVRSIGRQGIEVHAAPLDFTSPALRSRYMTKSHYLPLWVGDGSAWLDAMEALLRAWRFDMVIPCSEVGLLPLARHRERFASLTCLGIPDDRAIAMLFDKQATRELAESVGVPVSHGRLLRPDDTAERIIETFGTPLMLKPRRSYTLDMLDTRGKVQVIRSRADLAALLPLLSPEDYLLERFFAGYGVGVSLLADKGRVLQAFQHRRIRENHAGGSYYRVSTTPTPALVHACEEIVRAVDYTGLAMFEFRRNETDGAWLLLEVNARPWGSLPLPVALGVDFPFWWYRLLVEGVATPSVDYATGIYGRNLLPDLNELREAVQDAGRASPWVLLRRVAEFGRCLVGRERHDTFVRDDPWPGLAEIGGAVASLPVGVVRRLPGMKRVRGISARHRLRRIMRAASPDSKPRLLFVCAGNICRSPYAEAALRAFYPDLAGWIKTGSAGTLPREGRSTPDAGLLAARARGIDLSVNHSHHLWRETATTACVILVFDESNRNAIAIRHPDLLARIVLLGDLGGDGAISDPVNGDQALFMLCYVRIDQALSALAELLRESAARKTI
jgi:protein-tyrosine-phosphatase/predicted ATP-grasp superfamily ATP-dependent carboligase